MSKSNIRKARKARAKDLEPDEITDENAEEYLQILERIRNGTKTPKNETIQKHLHDVVINDAKINKYLNDIAKLEIIDITKMEKVSLLPSKHMVDEWYNNLSTIYEEISSIKNSEMQILNTVYFIWIYIQNYYYHLVKLVELIQ